MGKDWLDELIIEIKNLGDALIPYNFPKAHPNLENDLSVLKTNECIIDGYGVIIHYAKADYDDHYLESMQILGKNFPFLPFALVIKVARRFLGNDNLSLVELLKGGRKIYCWTLLSDKDGKTIISPEESEYCIFEGFEYRYMDSNSVNFY